MKIVNLPRAAQKGIKGAVVNVPKDLSNVCAFLPRTMSDSGIVAVKLKRQLHYTGHVNYQIVRPESLYKAIEYLRENNEHYSDVNLNEEWQSINTQDDSELWKTINVSSVSEDLQPQPQEGQPIEKEVYSESEEEEDTSNPAVHFDTCLQNATGPSLEFSIAPGEGKQPISFFRDENAEVMSCPREFPKGRFGYNTNRDTKLSVKKCFNSRLLSNDQRFAKNTSYIFYAQYIKEASQILQSINIALRKKKPVSLYGRYATAKDVIDNDSVNKLQT